MEKHFSISLRKQSGLCHAELGSASMVSDSEMNSELHFQSKFRKFGKRINNVKDSG